MNIVLWPDLLFSKDIAIGIIWKQLANVIIMAANQMDKFML